MSDILVQNSEEIPCPSSNASTDGTEVQASNEVTHTERGSALTGDGQQRDACTNESVDGAVGGCDNILALIPNIRNGSVGVAILGRVTKDVFSARSDATIFRKPLRRYQNITANMELAPEVVDMFKAITEFLTWRSRTPLCCS